ncbi:MAG TPA: 3-phosphoshikimate 1-carboxyvinyltransferase [Bacteroidales bacterium]|nr:3-phosphoshikimate 1-carboxyvinyltransferase [Bacteroidales bacterium]
MSDALVEIKSKKIRSSVTLPSSKSISNRLLVIQYLCRDGFRIDNLSDSGDTLVLQECLRNLHDREVFDAADAGTPFRLLTALFAVTPGKRVLTGSARMQKRPVGPLVDALNNLGAEIQYVAEKGYPPLIIDGKPLHGARVIIDAGVSSQFVSALLLIAPVLPDGLELKLKNNIASRPYIDMTLGLMKRSGISCKWQDDTILVKPQPYKGCDCVVEADWSAAAFWYEIAALAEEAEIELSGLQHDSLQGDAALCDIFTDFAVRTTFLNNSVIIRNDHNKPFAAGLDMFHSPDLFPALLVSAAALNVRCSFSGLRNLAWKESDRVAAMVAELERFGFHFSTNNNDMLHVEKSGKLSAAKNIVCNTYNDHRIAMALAPLSLLGYKVLLRDADCVVKSYPSYFDDLKKAGFDVRMC